jgi:hypothetical protein
MKRCLTSLLLRETQTKAKMRCNFMLTKRTVIKKTIANVNKDVEKLEPFYAALDNVNNTL